MLLLALGGCGGGGSVFAPDLSDLFAVSARAPDYAGTWAFCREPAAGTFVAETWDLASGLDPDVLTYAIAGASHAGSCSGPVIAQSEFRRTGFARQANAYNAGAPCTKADTFDFFDAPDQSLRRELLCVGTVAGRTRLYTGSPAAPRTPDGYPRTVDPTPSL